MTHIPVHNCPSFPCPICNPGIVQQPFQQPFYNLPPAPTITPMGCICPPTSEKTCESHMCPRKGIKISASGLVPNGER